MHDMPYILKYNLQWSGINMLKEEIDYHCLIL